MTLIAENDGFIQNFSLLDQISGEKFCYSPAALDQRILYWIKVNAKKAQTLSPLITPIIQVNQLIHK